jgi:hypothetical protein
MKNKICLFELFVFSDNEKKISHLASEWVESSKDKQVINGHEQKKDESSSDDDEPIDAPLQLKIKVEKLIK